MDTKPINTPSKTNLPPDAQASGPAFDHLGQEDAEQSGSENQEEDQPAADEVTSGKQDTWFFNCLLQGVGEFVLWLLIVLACKHRSGSASSDLGMLS